MAFKVCPHCGGSLTNQVPTFNTRVPELLAYFTEEITPIESRRLVTAGILLRLWASKPSGYRRLNQMEWQGWIASQGHGWYILTEKGRALAKSHGQPKFVSGLSDYEPAAAPPPERPIREDQVAPPSDWQAFIMRALQSYPKELYGVPAVVRYTRKSGFYIKDGAAQIHALIADGWLRWEGRAPTNRLVVSEAGLKYLAEHPGAM